MIRYGIISEVDYRKGRARVYFDEIDIISGWLSLPDSMRQSKSWPINCQVAAEMHANGEDGEILHRVITDDESAPSWANEKTEGYKFSDGTYISYNATTKELSIDAENADIVFKCKSLKVTGDIIADSGQTNISLINHLHTTPVGPSGKPIPEL